MDHGDGPENRGIRETMKVAKHHDDEQKVREAKPESVVIALADGWVGLVQVTPRYKAIQEFTSVAGLAGPTRGDAIH